MNEHHAWTLGQTVPYAPRRLVWQDAPRWYCLIAMPQQEGATVAWLKRKGIDAFFPVTSVAQRRPRAKIKSVMVHRKYLPGYVFARFPGEPVWHELFGICPFIANVMRLRSGVPGILHPDDMRKISAMRAVDEEAQAARRKAMMLRKGDKARILDGVMEGWEVEVHEVDTSTGKAKFRITLFGERETEIDMCRMEKIAAQPLAE